MAKNDPEPVEEIVQATTPPENPAAQDPGGIPQVSGESGDVILSDSAREVIDPPDPGRIRDLTLPDGSPVPEAEENSNG